MKGCRLLQDFLLPSLRNKTYGENLKWDPDDKCVFMLKWIHKAKATWSEQDAAVFLAWDKIKHRPKPKTHLDFVNSKQRLRAALRNVKTVQEVMSFNGYRRYKIIAMETLFKNNGQPQLPPELDNETVDIKPKVDVKDEKPLFPFNNEPKEDDIKKIKVDFNDVVETENKMYSLRNRSDKRVHYYESESEEEFDVINKNDENKIVMKIIKKEPKDCEGETQKNYITHENNNVMKENKERFNGIFSLCKNRKSGVRRLEKIRRLYKNEAKEVCVVEGLEHKGLKESIKEYITKSQIVKSDSLSRTNAPFSNPLHGDRYMQKNPPVLNGMDQVNDRCLAQEERTMSTCSSVHREKIRQMQRKKFAKKSSENNLPLCGQKLNTMNLKKVQNGCVKFDKNRVVEKDLSLNNVETNTEHSSHVLESEKCVEEVWCDREWPAVTSETELSVADDEPASEGKAIQLTIQEEKSEEENPFLREFPEYKWQLLKEKPYPHFSDPDMDLNYLLEYSNNTFLQTVTEKDLGEYEKYLEPFRYERSFAETSPIRRERKRYRNIQTQTPPENELNVDEEESELKIKEKENELIFEEEENENKANEEEAEMCYLNFQMIDVDEFLNMDYILRFTARAENFQDEEGNVDSVCL